MAKHLLIILLSSLFILQSVSRFKYNEKDLESKETLSKLYKRSLIFQRCMNMSLELGGQALVNKLVGRFADLSKCNYSNFFLQACFDSADFDTCFLIARELDPHLPFLVTHRYDNYVVQQLIKRFKRDDAQLPPCLLSVINNNRHSLQHDQWARFVLYAYDAAKGVLISASCGTILYHAMLVVGYGSEPNGRKFWIVKNSHGADWGEGGYIRIERGIVDPLGRCGIAMQPVYPLVR